MVFSSEPKINVFPAPKLAVKPQENGNPDGKINILMIIPWMEMGGADKFNLDVVKKINKDKFSVSIVTTLKAENEWKFLFEKYASDIQNLPDFLDVSDYAEHISYLIQARNIHVIFLSNSYYGYYLMPWLKLQFPQLIVIDYVHMEEWYWRSGGYARLSGMSECFADKTFVCNHKTNKVLVDYFKRSPETVETLYIGVDKEQFDSTKIPYGEVRKKYGIPMDKKVVLFPCRIHPQKRPFLMLEIAKKVLEQRSDIFFFVVGDGPQHKELLKAIKRAGLEKQFACPGQLSEMEKVYRDSDVTLICSLKEGLALTAYESCSMMTPVITADVGGQSELIDDTVGRVIPLMQDEKDIDNREYSDEEIQLYVQAISEILDDKEAYQQLCENCRKKITERFSTDVMIADLEREITELLGHAKRMPEVPGMLGLTENYLATYIELENYEKMSSLGYGGDTNAELKRIANSKWGRRAIKLLMKLKLNKIFH